MDGEHEQRKRTRRHVDRRPQWFYKIRLACGTQIVIEQTTRNGHLADLVDAPPGTVIERVRLTQEPSTD